MGKVKDRAQSVTEYLIATVFVLGAISLIGEPALEGNGLLIQWLGGQAALYIYMAWFAFLGLGLLFAKIRKRKKLHKNMLLAIYLTTVYTTILTIEFFGLSWAILDDVIVGVTAAIFWLRWKFKTEYLNLDEIRQLRREVAILDQSEPRHH